MLIILGSNSPLSLMQIMVIPRLTERLDCMLYRRRLELEIAEVKPDVDMVRNAGAELRSSLKFKQVLSVSP